MDALCRYDYPGNVRELENIVERAVVLTRSTQITIDDLPPQVVSNTTGRPASTEHDGPYQPRPLRESLEEPERRIILAALEANDWNRQRTAADLDINRTTLYKKMKQYGLGEG
jgi:two-component system response regulator HydG